MKIQLKLTPDTVLALHEVFEGMTASLNFKSMNENQRLVCSLAYDVLDKLSAAKKRRRADLFSANKKNVSITLKYHEAWGAEVLIRSTLTLYSDNPYKQTLLKKTADEINQKLF